MLSGGNGDVKPEECLMGRQWEKVPFMVAQVILLRYIH